MLSCHESLAVIVNSSRILFVQFSQDYIVILQYSSVFIEHAPWCSWFAINVTTYAMKYSKNKVYVNIKAQNRLNL